MESPRGTPSMLFPLYITVSPPIYVATTIFNLMALRNIRVDEALLSIGCHCYNETNIPPSLIEKVKRRKLKGIIMLCEKSWTSQICFYSVWIWTLNTLCFHREIGEIAIVTIFHLNSFIKKLSMTIW